MIRSLSAGVSGLRNLQARMDVIANNIANVNTTAFKAARVNFQEVMSAQIGLGVSVQSIDTLFGQGPPTTTNRVLDLMIDGNGFFRLAKYGGEEIINYYYTRDGAFYVNNDGYLVNSEGLYVLGVPELDEEKIAKVAGGDYAVDGAGERINLLDLLDEGEGLTTIRLDSNGLVFVNGRMDRAALILVDNYSNPEYLTRLGGNLYEAPLTTVGADTVPYPEGWGVPHSGGGQGKLLSGTLEMSNVDLSTEFANMITTQRGFQANARVITVSDEMLHELINLKR